MTQITINLPVSLLESAQCLGKATERELSEVLIDTLEIILPTFNSLSAVGNHLEVSHLLDSEVIELADSKMDAVQNQRLGELQAKGKNTGGCWIKQKIFCIIFSLKRTRFYRIGYG